MNNLTTLELLGKAKVIDSMPDEVLKHSQAFDELYVKCDQLEEHVEKLEADKSDLSEELWFHFQYLLDEIPTERKDMDKEDLSDLVDYLEKTILSLYQEYSPLNNRS